MPWYLSWYRVGICGIYCYFAFVQVNWILVAEDRFRRSLAWKPAIGTIFEHKVILNKFGASHVWYKFSVNGKEYVGDRFKSGGINVEEHVRHPTLLGVGTELVVYYDEENPAESAVKIASDRGSESFFVFNILLCLGIAYRCVRCETLWPNIFYRFMHMNRRIVETTGMRQQRKHNLQKTQYGPKESTPTATPKRN